MSFTASLRSSFVALSLLVPIAAHAQTPSPSAPGPGNLTAAPATTSGSSATAPAAQSPARFGVTPMMDDTTSRAVRGGASLGNLTYQGGPVQHTQKVFTIFWNPTGPAFPSGYQTTINQFVQDLNGSPYYAIGSQYSDGGGDISVNLTFGGTWLDTTNAFPSTSLGYSDLLAEVNRAKTANGWTSDANSYFQVYTPSGVNSTVGGICGLHWFANPAIGQILFPQSGCFPGSPYPNNSTVDAAINVSSHEIMETVTDPLGNAWYHVDASGEIGDECNFNFGSRASDGSNVTLNGRKYVIQQEWSNAVSGCAMSYNNGGPPAATTLLAPSGDISTNSPTYTWKAVTGASPATWYYLWVDDPSGTNIIKNWYSAASACGASTCSATPSVPVAGGTYRWWVETWNSAGYGPWSSSLTFVPGFAATTLISPAGSLGAGSTTPTYTWNKTGASYYYLWVDNGGGTPVIQTWYTAASACPATGGTCAVTPSFAITPGVTYTWWVETYYNTGGYGPWSGALTFSAGAPPAASLISPVGSIGTQSPTYTWNKVAAASLYFLWVDNAAGTPVIQTWYSAASVCSTSTCSVTPAVTLVAGNTHRWWVETWDGIGYGPWSASLSFTPAAPTAATLVSPTGAIDSVEPTYVWTKVPSATWYYLLVDDGATPVIQTWFRSDLVCGASVCSVTPATVLTTGTVHTFWVETWNPIGYGPLSAGRVFTPTATLPVAATLVSPANASTETSPGVTFQWNKVTAATWYELYVNNTSTGNVINQWLSGPSFCGVSLCSVPTPVNLTSGGYVWWVRTYSPAGYGSWSTGFTFSLASAPTSIVLTWNEYPSDLDAHLLTPQIAGTYYHVYWGARGSTVLPPYALLEHDRAAGFGAENIDVAQRFAGTYRYFVHNYSGTPPLTGSGAKVKIYEYDTLLTTLTAPATGTGDYWQVCDINGATGALVTCPNVIGEPEPTFADGRAIDGGGALKVKPATDAADAAADAPSATQNQP